MIYFQKAVRVMKNGLKLLGNALKKMRKKSKLTQKSLCKLARLDYRNYQDIERGKTDFKVSTLIRVCKALNISMQLIIKNTGL